LLSNQDKERSGGVKILLVNNLRFTAARLSLLGTKQIHSSPFLKQSGTPIRKRRGVAADYAMNLISHCKVQNNDGVVTGAVTPTPIALSAGNCPMPYRSLKESQSAVISLHSQFQILVGRDLHLIPPIKNQLLT